MTAAPTPAMAYAADAAAGIAILLWAADPREPERLATPFVHATAAAVMEWPVEMYFTARSVHLLVPGLADGLRASPLHPRTIGDTMREALAQGVRMYACSDALAAQGLAGKPLIEGCAGHGGAVQFMARAGDLRWRALVY